jgi:pimeloyl-ACP methyl ester carboxylesterase
MVDPVPSLLSGPGVTSDANALSSGGTKVIGVAADGIAQVVLKIPSSRLAESFTLSVYNNEVGAPSTPSVSPDLDGGLLVPGGSIVDPRSSLTVKSVQTGAQYQAFAVYRAPLDFTRPGTSDATRANRSVKVIVQSIDGPSGSIDVDIERPPVLLVHGIWGNLKTWKYFCPDKQTGDECTSGPLNTPLKNLFATYAADYEGTNYLSFATNANAVFADEMLFLRQYKLTHEVASVQWDVVAHSMGGNVIRTLLTDARFQRSSNYNLGDFHKLITIDTPHLGSEFATRLAASNPYCQFAFNSSGKLVGDGIRDLSPGSAALLRQGTSLPTHAIGAAATSQQATSAELRWSVLGLGDLCPSMLPVFGGFDGVFAGAENDLIVSISSQLAKGGAATSIPATTIDAAIHAVDDSVFIAGPDVLARTVRKVSDKTSVIGSSSPIPQKVIDLLNSWVTDKGQFDVSY